jgi:nitroreductase
MKYNLSEVTAIIQNRRSISPETYSTRKVHREIVEHVLNNARWAPSHALTQPWRFKVYMKDGMKKLEDALPEMYRNQTPPEKFKEVKYEKLKARMQNMSVVVAICMQRDDEQRIPEIEEIEAVACAVQNMYLTCTAFGLGAFWSSPGFVYSDEMKTFLGLRPEDRCLGLFYMGYPTEDWPSGHRKPLEYLTDWIE